MDIIPILNMLMDHAETFFFLIYNGTQYMVDT